MTLLSRLCRRWKWWLALLAMGLVAGMAADAVVTLPRGLTATYVGSQRCAQCHAEQAEKHRGSDHAKALDHARAESVLAAFADETFEHGGESWQFTRRDQTYVARLTRGEQPAQEYEIRYVIGVKPLQQYVIEAQRGLFRVLPVAWDTREQRWFHVRPDDPAEPGDPLHWSESSGNFNHMCADCHVTQYAKNYHSEDDRYQMRFAEGTVGCEACHGPGSLHVETASSRWPWWDRRYGYALPPLREASSKMQLDTCAPCHSHRRQLAAGFEPGKELLDFYLPSLLEEPLYHVDGQIREEVYEYGSFHQSLMAKRGVRCSNCHDPHSCRVKFDDNRLCTQCHQSARFDTPAHHHHAVDTRGARCVECHMPGKLFMQVDFRRDHSLRVPRPDLTLTLGTPNACNTAGCHDGAARPRGEDAAWAAKQIDVWTGGKPLPNHFATAFHKARQALPEAEAPLVTLLRNTSEAAIARATAASLLDARYAAKESETALQSALKDEHPLVRAAAMRSYAARSANDSNPVEPLRKHATHLLHDPVRAVRIEAARGWLPFARASGLSGEDHQALQRVIAEYRDSLTLDDDLAASHRERGDMHRVLGDTERAIGDYRAALAREPGLIRLRPVLANLLVERGQADEAKKLRQEEERLLSQQLAILPQSADLWIELGAIRLQLGDAIAAGNAFLKATEVSPDRSDAWQLVAEWHVQRRDWVGAQRAAKEVVRLRPKDANAKEFQREIERQMQMP